MWCTEAYWKLFDNFDRNREFSQLKRNWCHIVNIYSLWIQYTNCLFVIFATVQKLDAPEINMALNGFTVCQNAVCVVLLVVFCSCLVMCCDWRKTWSSSETETPNRPVMRRVKPGEVHCTSQHLGECYISSSLLVCPSTLDKSISHPTDIHFG